MNIKKVYIKNFKGIKEKTIVNFDDNVSLLVGPNGFGKTTVFDVIELAFTGKIYRTDQKKVTNDINNYKKPFFQNTLGEDVIIKVWLENSKGEELIIVKILDKDVHRFKKTREKKNKPQDFTVLETYRDLPQNFYSDYFDKTSNSKISQKDIEQFLEIADDSFELIEIFNLFNYLQQEETTFFLKKSEYARKDALGFLFQTTKQEEKLKEINNSLQKLNEIHKLLKEKKEQQNLLENIDRLDYKRIFLNENFEFDKKVPFAQEKLEVINNKKENYFNILDKIINFKKSFSPIEYNQKNKLDYISNNIKDDLFLNHIVLKKMLDNEMSRKIEIEYEFVTNQNYIKTYLLKNYLGQSNTYILNNQYYNKYVMYINILKKHIFEDNIELIKEICEKINPEYKEFLITLLEEHKLIKRSMKVNDFSLREIINYRNKIYDECHNHEVLVNSQSCPYCGYDWESTHELDARFDETENEIRNLMNSQNQRIIDIESIVKRKFVLPLVEIIQKKMNEIVIVNEDVIEVLKDLEDLEDLNLNISGFEKLINKSKSDYSIVIDIEDIKIETLIDMINSTLLEIKNNITVNTEIYEILNQVKYISFEKELLFIEKELPELNIDDYSLESQEKSVYKIIDIEKSKTLLREAITSYSKKFSYSLEMVKDPYNLYNQYFDNNKKKFEVVSTEEFQEKKQYITYQYNLNSSEYSNVLNEKLSLIDSVIDKLKVIKLVYSTEINAYKKEMIREIKLPFFLYTAKVLQNYQQGLGIFLSTKSMDGSIRFLTDPSTDHDAMHHLSSGQIAVISLAFTLAINRTYNISDNLKFLVIDDPIQDMDSMNVHSFIELLRHEFIEDYQIILSTHNDSSAMYMKYKFERRDMATVKVIDVQSEFFNSNG